MIPDFFDDDTPSSERRVFSILKEGIGTEDWIVQHRLGLADRGDRKPYGEIDVIVLIPGLGIACLEVKGGRVRCENGTWYTVNRNGLEAKLSKSPIMQAREEAQAVRKAIKAWFGESSDEGATVIASAVVFPDIVAPPPGIEAERWEYVDMDDLKRPIVDVLKAVIRRTRERIGKRFVNPEAQLLRGISQRLRPDFDRVVARPTVLNRIEAQIISLTEEQYYNLDTLAINARCMVQGAAGTGKTMLAVEYARRAAKRGRHPVVVCFNKLLGRWLKGELQNVNATTGHLHSLLRRVIGDDVAEQSHFDEWPLSAATQLEQNGPLGDLLIVDEAQDFMNDKYLIALNSMLKGGLKRGHWAMFGDFTHQRIRDRAREASSASDALSFLDKWADYSRLQLSMNCRNTRQIAQSLVSLADGAMGPLRQGAVDGWKVEVRWRSGRKAQVEALSNAMRSLLGDGIKSGQIIILSPLKYEDSIAHDLNDVHVWNVAAGDSSVHQDAVGFCTIQTFKGMESPFAILADLSQMTAEDRQVLYTGMSRASAHLILIGDKAFERYYNARLRA